MKQEPYELCFAQQNAVKGSGDEWGFQISRLSWLQLLGFLAVAVGHPAVRRGWFQAIGLP
jgi:hypothetical protein